VGELFYASGVNTDRKSRGRVPPTPSKEETGNSFRTPVSEARRFLSNEREAGGRRREREREREREWHDEEKKWGLALSGWHTPAAISTSHEEQHCLSHSAVLFRLLSGNKTAMSIKFKLLNIFNEFHERVSFEKLILVHLIIIPKYRTFCRTHTVVTKHP